MRIPLSILFVILFASPTFALVLDKDTFWDGEHVLTEDVRVLPGATLTIAPGTLLHFSGSGLEVAGHLVAEGVVFTGENWEGLRLKGVDTKTRLVDCEVKGAAIGVFIQGGAPLLRGVKFSGNHVGIEIRGKAAGQVVACSFLDNQKVGLFLKDDSTTAVIDCHFKNNLRYGAYLYHALPRAFQGNRFVENDVALMIAYHGTDPEVIANRFEKNRVAIQVDRAARPLIRGNLLLGNQTGLYIYRRSDPRVIANRIEANEVGFLVAYSSYPEIKGNDILHNQLALRLEFQSSSWESQRGAGARAAELSARSAFAGQGMRSVTEEDRRARRLDGVVDAVDNWWGEEGTLELAGIGKAGNPSFIHDGRDQTTFVDAGAEFLLDKVEFSPWAQRPLTEMQQ